MTYDLRISRRASRYLEHLDRPTQERIKRAIEEILEDPFSTPRSKALTGFAGRASRVGDYRIIYLVDVESNSVTIDKIGPRGQVYRQLD